MFVIIGCNNSPMIQTKYIVVHDTTKVEDITKIVAIQRELDLVRDSLNSVRDSLGEDLFVAKYKLSRIKYYVDIAAKGNNIKYLRGWCLRVLNE